MKKAMQTAAMVLCSPLFKVVFASLAPVAGLCLARCRKRAEQSVEKSQSGWADQFQLFGNPIMRSLVTVLTLWCLIFSATARAGEQYAFLVGVGAYDEKELKSLPYSRADILEFRDELLASGVKPENIVLMVDDLAALSKSTPVGRFLPEARKIREELSVLIPSLQPDDSLIIALAGHGVQFKNDAEPYFCPADVKLKDKNSLISLSWICKQLEFDAKTMQGCKARQRLLIVDACRNDPRTVVARSSGGPELESLTKPQLAPLPAGLVALFSCAEGQQALEHSQLQHGVFFYHLLQAWRGQADVDGDRRITLDEMVAFTKAKTRNYARLELRAAQTPRQKGFFEGTWNLRTLSHSKLVTNSLGMKLALIPAGEFLMGSPESDKNRRDDQHQHRVKLSKPFYLQTTEVTQRQWNSVMGTTPWKGKKYVKEGDDYPATYVSLDDAQEFIKKLNTKEQVSTYRLPTEAEWEYACRAGTTTAYSFRNNSGNLGDYAWYIENAYGTGEKYARLVATRKPNTWGLYDMHGNVWEWCSDWYDKDYHKQVATRTALDPQGPSGGSYRVNRGGSWFSNARICRSANRNRVFPDRRSDSLGFRVAQVRP